jgi:hypothetical protein
MSQVVWLSLVVIAVVAVGALDVLFVTAHASQITVPQIPLIIEDDPCRLVTCGPANIHAYPVGINPLTKNVRCKCPNRAEAYYEVSPERKY